MSKPTEREARQRLFEAIARQVAIQEKLGGKTVMPPKTEASAVDTEALAAVLGQYLGARHA